MTEREHFALWTPDEYDRVQPLDPKHGVAPGAYVCTTAPGASIVDACREGVEIAKLVEGRVAFVFNGVAVVCLAADDPEKLEQAWRASFASGGVGE